MDGHATTPSRSICSKRNAGNMIVIGDRNLIKDNAVKNAVGCGDECGYRNLARDR